MKKKTHATRVPPEHDAFWLAATAPLLRFIDEGPKTWPALKAWARSVKLTSDRLRQSIAWAEGRRLIRYEDGRWAKTQAPEG